MIITKSQKFMKSYIIYDMMILNQICPKREDCFRCDSETLQKMIMITFYPRNRIMLAGMYVNQTSRISVRRMVGAVQWAKLSPVM